MPQLSRRSGRGGSGGTGSSSGGIFELATLEDYLAKNLYSWMRADYRTEVGGKVASFIDKVTLVGNVASNARTIDSSHALTQANPARQVAAVGLSASMNNRETASFVRATGNYYDSTIADWRFLHDGTGGEVWITVLPSADTNLQALYGTRAPAGVGITSARNSGGSQGQVMYVLKTGGVFNVASIVPGAAPNNVAKYVDQKLKLSDTPNYVQRASTTVIDSGSITNSPMDSGINAAPLRLGSDGGNHADMLWSDLLVTNNPSPTLLTNVQRYMFLRYALA